MRFVDLSLAPDLDVLLDWLFTVGQYVCKQCDGMGGLMIVDLATMRVVKKMNCPACQGSGVNLRQTSLQ